MRKYSVRVTPSAIQDIEEIVDFYIDMVDEESAARFSDDLIETLENLDTFPESNAYFDKVHGLRRVHVKNHKVSVVYVIDNGVYEVIAFGAFHALAQPSVYTKRLIERLKEL
ncbi:MAG: type II toxin-antitoxin system RelE/ParE family toxin [Candidatus Saccharimonadales bacterium]